MTATQESIDMARIAGQAAADKLAGNVIALDVSEQLVITDVFVVCSGDSERQVNAIVNGVEEEMFKAGYKPKRREGEKDARWILLDFTDIVVHVQHAEDRAFYALERLWRDAPTIDLDLDLGPEAESQEK
ncbi:MULTISPECIES: ribosome silencing factor [Dermabacter]|uniref:Ribosomal silencing factor RsfS n=1 Tax=Dermabacter vaginalis TaxID=1630135 RepID=A0ABX6A3M8_9MICO|nr:MULTISPECIES: ribosome silencing factor [Dermabacter]QEU11803.1 ribosome silencing factor [Dermabacter vaginalis]RUP87327.1 ribosome silencing factor [Dermabacter sp. HSID17554]